MGEVEGGEGGARAAALEEGGRAREADGVVREDELGEGRVVLELAGERLGAANGAKLQTRRVHGVSRKRGSALYGPRGDGARTQQREQREREQTKHTRFVF